MPRIDQAKSLRVGSKTVSAVFAGSVLAWPKTVATPVRPRGSNASHTSCTLSWDAVPDATAYEVRRSGTTIGTYTAASCNVSGLANSTNYDFDVRAKRVIGGTTIYSAWSPKVRLATGRPEARKQGNFAWEGRPSNTGTYRPADGWSYNGSNVAQGYYTQSTHTGFGTITFNGAAFRNWVSANYGADVLNNLYTDSAWVVSKVCMYRNATSGHGGAVGLNWHVTSSVAHSGGQPPLAGGAQGGALDNNQSGWMQLPWAHWGKHILLNDNLGGNGGVYVCNSFCLYYGGTAWYAIFLGPGHAGNSCNLYVECKWDFVTQTYIAPAWSNI